MPINPTPYPWVNFLLTPTKAVGSTPLLVFGSQQHCIVDSIFACNTTNQDIFVDVKVLAERDLVAKEYCLYKKLFIPKLDKRQLITKDLYLQTGDLLYASSDFSGSLFDVEVSGRELTELSEETAIEPFSYPWVNFLMNPFSSIGSTPQMIVGSQYPCVVDSILACNTTDQDIYIDLTILTERSLVAQNNQIVKRLLLTKYKTEELLSLAPLGLQDGDLLYVNSDFSSNRFDCLVSYREIREEAP